MKIRINPSLWGIQLELFEVDLSTLFSKILGKNSHAISKDVEIVLTNTLNYIAQQRYESGPSFGGWGKDYKEKYYNQMYPKGLPADVIIYPDSITFTGMVIDALRCINDIPQENNTENAISFFDYTFGDAREYLLRRYKDDESGLFISTSGGEGVIACNLRHTATAIFAWLRVQGDEGRVARLFKSVIQRIHPGYDYSQASPSTIACVLGALYLADHYNLFGTKISKEQLNSLKGIAEFELLRHFNSKHNLWCSIDNEINNCTIWHALWILKFAFKLGYSTNTQILNMYDKVIHCILNKWGIEMDDTLAIPLLPNGNLDIGATGCMIEILKFGPHLNEPKFKNVITKMSRFIIKHGNNQIYLKDTYSWTRASVINALLSQEIWGIPYKEIKHK